MSRTWLQQNGERLRGVYHEVLGHIPFAFDHLIVPCCCSLEGDAGVVRNFECECDASTCSADSRCFGLKCFTSLSVQNGTAVTEKGCIVGSEEDVCSRPPTSELVVECCEGDLCNTNASLQFPVKGTGRLEDSITGWNQVLKIRGLPRSRPRHWNNRHTPKGEWDKQQQH
ncbi:hypothetical protein WMY93_002819 [Mugilogobius chulae]|uniref:Uncharacterized protein n=1 Tax=Mugilogobius chulae TaxID=88201 RepID=A0AAW0PWH1_9GOBI